MCSQKQDLGYTISVQQKELACPDVLKQGNMTFIQAVSPVWDKLTKGLSDELEQVQKRRCRTILFFYSKWKVRWGHPVSRLLSQQPYFVCGGNLSQKAELKDFSPEALKLSYK